MKRFLFIVTTLLILYGFSFDGKTITTWDGKTITTWNGVSTGTYGTYYAKVGSFNIDPAKTATATHAINGVGFQPKIVLFFWGGSTETSDNVSGGWYNIGFGAAISDSSRFAIVGESLDASASSSTGRASYADQCIRAYDNGGTVDGVMDFVSMDVDGFTLVVDNQFTNAFRISYLALGGDGLTNVFIGNHVTATSNGTYDVTGVGFQPDAMIFAQTICTSLPNEASGFYLSLGITTGSGNQGVIYGYGQDSAAAANTSGYGYNAEVVTRVDNTTEALSAFIADGFTMSHTQGGTAYIYHYIALKGGHYSVGDVATLDSVADLDHEAVGFQPSALFFLSANRALSTSDTLTDNLAMSIGAATSSTNRACAAVYDKDAADPTETTRANYDSAVYANLQTDTVVGLMDLKSVDATGFTLTMTDADPSACWVTYLAIGE
jgi:hypothetical protein